MADAGGTSFSDILVKYGQRFQIDKTSMQASLFSELEPIETNRPAMPTNYEKWSDLERLEAEKKMVTMYLSAHPLDAYYMELTYGCNTKCEEVNEKLTEKHENEPLSFGGFVTDFIVKTTAKGTPYGILKIEDFSGNIEMRLFGKNFQIVQPYGIKGSAIRINGVVERQRYREGFELRIGSVDYLVSLKETVATSLFITVPSNQSAKDLKALLTDPNYELQRPGDVVIVFKDVHNNQTVEFKSKKKIDISRGFLRNLDEAGIEYVVKNN
jgi:DNA polymerase-3 subunit alpha